MICIFCKKDSTTSKSVEHIIPESIGNTKNVLPKGIVCDICNEYFGRKIEQPVLALPFFSQLRARNGIQSKKKRIPPEKLLVYHPEVDRDAHESLFIRSVKGMNMLSTSWPIASKIMTSRKARIIVESLAFNDPPVNDVLVARLLGKIGVEILAQSVLDNQWDLSLILWDERLDPLRHFTRYGKPGQHWEYHVRKVYGENDKFFYDHDLNTAVDVLYNYGHFFINEEMFLSLILKGYEFTINMGSPEIGRFIRWVLVNNGKSAIYNSHVIIQKEHPIPFFRLD